MATCEMKDHIEDNSYNRYAIDFELLVTLDELDEQYELAWPESLNPSSASQNQDDILEDFCLFADILLPCTRKEEINVQKFIGRPHLMYLMKKRTYGSLKPYALDLNDIMASLVSVLILIGSIADGIVDLNNSTSWCTEDTSSMQEKEGGKGQKQKDVDLSFLDAFDIEELCGKEPEINDIENVSPSESAQPKVKIICQRRRKVEPSLRILLLKSLVSSATCFYELL